MICGAPFFLQIPGVDKWVHASVQFTPIGDPSTSSDADRWIYFVRIYTSVFGIGRIQVNNVDIDAMLYISIPLSDFYYYDIQTTRYADNYRISAFDTNVTFSVSWIYVFECSNQLVCRLYRGLRCAGNFLVNLWVMVYR